MTLPGGPLAAVDLGSPLAIVILGVVVGALMLVDLLLFARNREPSFREAAIWSIGWFVASLLVFFPVAALEGTEHGINYVTVYLIERSLSLDNLFVFILLFAYFAVPAPERPRLLFWGIVAAFLMRGAAILGGVALIERFEWVLYLLGALLLVLAYRVYRGVAENTDPGNNLAVRATRKVFPLVPRFEGHHWFIVENGKRFATPLLLCFVGIVFADIAFAIDSIPAAFGITREASVIWLANGFALLGLRALFVLVEQLIARLRYLDETIAVVLAVIALKLLTEHWVHLSPVTSLAIVLGVFAIGIAASLIADARDPHADERRREREEKAEAMRGRAGQDTDAASEPS
jgi:tellurite resistance protein TerC